MLHEARAVLTQTGAKQRVASFESRVAVRQAVRRRDSPNRARAEQVVEEGPSAASRAGGPVAIQNSGCFSFGLRRIDMGGASCAACDWTWDPTEGATTYYAEHASRVHGWAFADPFVDGPYTSCTLDLRETSMVRVKACNGCGCSD